MQYRVLNGSSAIMESYDCYSGYGGNEALFNGMLPFNVYETTAGDTNSRTYKVQEIQILTLVHITINIWIFFRSMGDRLLMQLF